MSSNLYDTTLPVKDVKLNIGYGITHLPVTINHDTGILFSLAEDMNPDDGSGNSMDISTLFPKFDEGALSLYIYFLSGLDTTKVLIVNRNTMIGCLAIYDYTGDNNFFHYIITCLFKLWTMLSPVLYSNKVSEEVKWELWLHLPHQLLPESWQLDPVFMKTWRSREDNKHIVINGDEIFDFEQITEGVVANDDEDDDDENGQQVPVNQITVTKKVTSYVRQHDDVNISDTETKELNNGKLVVFSASTTYDDSLQGSGIVESNNIKEVFNAINDRDNGPYMEYDGQGKLKSLCYKINGKIHGTKVYYYDNGRIRRKTQYNDGVFDGFDTQYFDQPILEPEIDVEWRNGNKLEQAFNFRDKFVIANYVVDNNVYQLPGSYDFYTPDGILTRRITYPVSPSIDKHDIKYDGDKNIIDDITYNSSWTYHIKKDKWYH